MKAMERSRTRHRPTVAVVDLDAIRHNVRALLPDTAALMAVVKANGYGHGDAEVARAAVDAGATWLGVAMVEEGLRLRDHGIDAPILVLTEFPAGSEADAVAAGLTPTLYSFDALQRLAEAARSFDQPLPVHVKVDTGMHRVGLPPDRTVPFLDEVQRAGFALEGLWTHFAKSEELSDPFTKEQLERFREVVSAARAAGFHPRYLHAANTGAAMALPESHLDIVRVGLGVYGLCPGPELQGRFDLRPALSWKSAVTMVKRVDAGEGVSYGLRYRVSRPSNVATVPVGYADGYSRLLGERGEVLIRGRRYPIAGAITMDQLMVDCGDDAVEVGDEVVLLGRQGDEKITADELAERIGTINYEIVCGISDRVPREYVGG